MIDATHDPALESWVESANDAASDFPLQNLPFGRFRSPRAQDWRTCVAIGDRVLDLEGAGLAVRESIVGLSAERRRELRAVLSAGLRRGSGREHAWAGALHPMAEVELGVPCAVRGYTDFYTGIHHATAVGRLMRPDHPLLPNYKWVPIGYHGRSSSIVASGSPVVRPQGQLMPPGAAAPYVGPTRRLDYELEIGIVAGPGNPLGVPIPLECAEAHVAGLTLLNDWSARDVQAWEYQPLGPFLAKNFATSLSPWIVTLEALAPFRRPFARPEGDPPPLPYLDGEDHRRSGHVAVDLEVRLQTPRMREAGLAGDRISRSSYLDAYWTLAQLVTHHTMNGCPLEAGDVLGTGTLSGPQPEQGGSLLERTQGGKVPLQLSTGEERRFLEDGDTVILSGSCDADGFRRIGFGRCEGTIRPAR